ncbi:MAG: HAD-IIIA family hydrolase [Nocardioides sp.]|uniref:D-glycero-alpha-D-manno-heptose-1,7-bisphosphate 7-phosphatase n=1 Tax=Nocardioides sp. TaxID=35761 RepID=UPI0039E53A29
MSSSPPTGRTGADWVLFLDRDGVVNRRVVDGYVLDWSGFELLPGVVEAIGILAAWAPHVVLVTNQQGVGKGLMSRESLDDVHARLRALTGEAIEDVLVCPHLASDGCECRKPGTLLARTWLAAHPEVDPALSVMVGDSASDMEMAARLAEVTGGCLRIGIGEVEGAEIGYPSLADLAADVDDHQGGPLR